MRLLHKDYQFVFDLNEQDMSLLVIEHPETYRSFIQEILIAEEGGDCNFVLSENDTPIKIQNNLYCIINPFTLSLNERKLLNKLYEVLKREIQSSDLLIDNNEIYSMIEKYGQNISKMSDWDITYTDKPEVQSLLKFMDIRFAEHPESLIEKIVEYMDVAHELLRIRLFVFVHLLSYLSRYEIEKNI